MKNLLWIRLSSQISLLKTKDIRIYIWVSYFSRYFLILLWNILENLLKEELIMIMIIGIVIFFVATCYLDEYLAREKGGEKDEK